MVWPYRNDIKEFFKCIWQREWSQVARFLLFWKQYLTRGFSDDELWSLDATIAQFISPRLRHFRKYNIGLPLDAGSKEEWDEILDKIVEAMELIADSSRDWQFNREKTMKVTEGCELLGKWLTSMWD